MKNVILISSLLVSPLAFGGLGGSHSGLGAVPYNPYNTVTAVADDAAGFKVVGVKIAKMPFGAVNDVSPNCTEGGGSCNSYHFVDYRPVVRVTVGYQTSQQAYSEYPIGNDATADFHIPVSEAALAKVAELPKKERIAAVEKLVQPEKVARAYRGQVVTKVCERELVGETEWRLVDPNCQDEYGWATFTSYSLKLNLK